MNEAESREWRDRLGEVMTEYDLKRVLEQVERHIRFGRTSEKEIQPLSERQSGQTSGTGTDLLPLPPTPAYSSGRKARFLASRDYSQNEMLEIVIDAVERGVADTALALIISARASRSPFLRRAAKSTPQFQKNLSSNEVKDWEAASPQDRLWFV